MHFKSALTNVRDGDELFASFLERSKFAQSVPQFQPTLAVGPSKEIRDSFEASRCRALQGEHPGLRYLLQLSAPGMRQT